MPGEKMGEHHSSPVLDPGVEVIFGLKGNDFGGVDLQFEDSTLVVGGEDGQGFRAAMGADVHRQYPVVEGLFTMVAVTDDVESSPLNDGGLQQILGATTEGLVHGVILPQAQRAQKACQRNNLLDRLIFYDTINVPRPHQKTWNQRPC